MIRLTGYIGIQTMQAIQNFLQEIGGFAIFFGRVVKTYWTTHDNVKPIAEQIVSVTLRSLSTVVFAGVFVGAILVLQFSAILSHYDALSFLGGLNTSAVVRQVGPLIISFLIAGKIGAFTAAELGTMRVTEQIDAIQCLGTNPLQYLIVPRFAGIIVASLILLFVGMFISIGGAMAVASIAVGVNPLQFVSSIPKFTAMSTLVGGLFQSFVYGHIVAGVACYKGYTATGGARGVGRAVTLAAIYTNLYIVIANYLTSMLIEWVGLWLSGGVG